MAGIGFSLRKLFNQRGVIGLCRAYGFAGIISVGPMLLGVALLAGVSTLAKISGMGGHDRELLNCMLTYSLLASLTVTSWFNMSVTRYISDMLFEDRNEKVIPSFYGAASIMLVLCILLYGTFLYFSGVRLIYKLLCLWFSLVLILVWTETIYLTALKDYSKIVLSFAISLSTGFLAMLICVLLGYISIVSFMLCIIGAYGILAVKYLREMLDFFPRKEGSNFSFLAWIDEYRPLVVSGGFLNIGLFSHLIIMYFGPLKVQVEGLFYGAPSHDVPAIYAFFCLLITTVTFIVSVEVKFYPKYQNYYGLFNERGSIFDIHNAEKEMLVVLRQELTYMGHKQVFTTVLFIALAPLMLNLLNLKLGNLEISIFRYLCVGYGTYALANSTMLILLYFEDYRDALIGSVIFGASSTVITIFQILYGRTEYFGLGFVAAAMLFYVYMVFSLDKYTRKLPYHLLARQSLLPKEKKGVFTSISKHLDERYERLYGNSVKANKK